MKRRERGITRRKLTAGAIGSAVTAMFGRRRAQARAPRKVDVVVVGGGFGGATAAKYLKRLAPRLSVVLVEQRESFHTCPFSNLVIAGLRPLSSIEHRYERLGQRWGVEVVHRRAAALDPVAKTVSLDDGTLLGFEKAVLSPGIDFRWNALAGYDEAAAQVMPHAWQAGPQTALLRRRLEAMGNGGTVIIVAPADPYRCPPGPYERASLIAHYLRTAKPKSKVLILDAKETFSKEALFREAWGALYPEMIEHVRASDDGEIVEADAATGTLKSAFGEVHRGDVVNVIPPQWAGQIAREAGLADESGWCPVSPETFVSKMAPDVHVIGDSAIAGQMPKSGFSANSQGKIAAVNIIAALTGREPAPGSYANACYSLLGPDYGISVAKVYRSTVDGIVGVDGSGGLSPLAAAPEVRAHEARFAEGWYAAITQDMFA